MAQVLHPEEPVQALTSGAIPTDPGQAVRDPRWLVPGEILFFTLQQGEVVIQCCCILDGSVPPRLRGAHCRDHAWHRLPARRLYATVSPH